MKRSVVLHRRVQKKLREKALPHDQVSKCVRLLCEGQTDHLGLRMKRLKGVDRPVFEARVNRDVRLIFTIQPAHEYGGANGGTGRSDGNHLRDRIVVWDVDHHDDALSAARRISYDSLHQAEELCLASSLHEQGILEEIGISKLPEYPTVPLSIVEREVKTGKSVLNQYIRPHYRGEEWWLEQASSVEQESLYDAQEFLEIGLDRIEQDIEHLAQSDEDFLLHLLPEQMEFVRKPGPLLLSGTVGSGKTTILLYHLYRQARANPAGRYLVVTYSPTLTSLCQLLFEHLPRGRELLERVDILSYEDMLSRWFPNVRIESYTEMRRQFHEAYQRVKEVWKMGNLKEPLRSWKRRHREFPWDEETLWAEYWDVIKGQLNWQTRQLLDREGYLHNAASDFSVQEREAIFAAIQTWFPIGGSDELDLSRKLWEQPEKVVASYDGVYVDEIQDLCEVQWMLLMRLVRHPAGLFLTGDPFQALRPSGFHWNRLVRRLSQEVTVLEGSLKLNLRNSRQIALFVQGELERIKREYDLDEMPDYHVTALLDGLPPAAATLDSPALSAQQLAEWLGDQGAVIVWDESDKNIPIAQQLGQHGALLCSVEEAKGLEFDRVILFNIYSRMHEQVRRSPVLRLQAFSRLYVALTRARRGLVVVEDTPQSLPPSLPKLSKQWLSAWEAAERVVVRSYEALTTNPAIWTRARRMEWSGRLEEAAELY
ncbi:ATP-dependent helicase/nuclease subunit A [bacterium HR16]|nr:ATP-dependent helicase/nuclease subunit A [bacterium HR16]